MNNPGEDYRRRWLERRQRGAEAATGDGSGTATDATGSVRALYER